MKLLKAASEMIRWRRETALWATLKAVGNVVNEHPGAFVDDIESGVLIGLGHLVTETAVSGGRDAGIKKNGPRPRPGDKADHKASRGETRAQAL